jgi:hypothetical protein
VRHLEHIDLAAHESPAAIAEPVANCARDTFGRVAIAEQYSAQMRVRNPDAVCECPSAETAERENRGEASENYGAISSVVHAPMKPCADRRIIHDLAV